MWGPTTTHFYLRNILSMLNVEKQLKCPYLDWNEISNGS